MRVFLVHKDLMEGKYPNCLVCEKKFELSEEIVLAPIQEPRNGFESVICIPIHEKCYWVEPE